MKKIFLSFLIFFAAGMFSASVAVAQTSCPAGQSPVGSLGPNNTIVYTCAATPNNAANAQITVPNGQGQNLGYTPLEPIPGVTTAANGTALDFPHLLGNVYKIAIIVGALFSVLMLTISGVRYMLSDVVTDKERAKKRIRACLYGLVLIAASWLILNTINPQLTTFNLNPGIATVTAPAPGSSTGSGTTDPCASTSCGAGSNCVVSASGLSASPTGTCVPNGYFGSNNPATIITEVDNSGNVIPAMQTAQDIQNVLNMSPSPATCNAMRDLAGWSVGSAFLSINQLIGLGWSGTGAQSQQVNAYVNTCANTVDGTVSGP